MLEAGVIRPSVSEWASKWRARYITQKPF
jgi:hypothetical protein